MSLFLKILIHRFSILCFFSLSFAQHPGDEKVREGINAFYNYEYEKSIDILSEARIEYPLHPVVHAVWAASWYQFDQSQFDENKVYCYYVVTSGSYENDKLPLNLIYKDKLVNNSQKICAQTNDLTPPCPPVNFKISDDYSCENYFSDKSCEIKDFENRIEWTIEDDPCYLDSKFFNVYFSSNGDDNFKIVGTVNENYFIHKELTNLKGAYYITALDRSGNESLPSDTIRRDNCPKYYLPNVFTPNGDGKNDYFTPFFSDGSITDFNYSNCPRFVRSVQITIVDRTGKEVFNHDSNENIVDGIYINWDGRNKSGINLPSDTYYYLATVTFDILDETENIKEIKGWVQILR